MMEIMGDLRQHCDAAAKERAGRRQPVCLFLDGGMAAGKSTVREIIGKDMFWSKVGFAVQIGRMWSGSHAQRSCRTL